jgi:hypothetical protein
MSKGFEFIKKTDPIPARNLFTVIYGLPGVGKTTLCFTASDNTLHINFDSGFDRAHQDYRPDRFQATDYGKLADYLMSEDFEDFVRQKQYKAVCLDTVGTLLDDFIAPYLIKKDAKYGSSIGLTLAGWGALGNSFSLLINRLRSLNLEVVAICHAKEVEDDGVTHYRLAVKGSSSTIIYQTCDLLGYLQIIGGDRVLNFNSTQKAIGKNIAGFDAMKVPDADSSPRFKTFLGDLIDATKEKMTSESEAQVEYRKKLDEWTEKAIQAGSREKAEAVLDELEQLGDKTLFIAVRAAATKYYNEHEIEAIETLIENAETVEDFNSLVAVLEKSNKDVSSAVRKKFAKAMADCGFKYDKDEGKVVEDE